MFIINKTLRAHTHTRSRILPASGIPTGNREGEGREEDLQSRILPERGEERT